MAGSSAIARYLQRDFRSLPTWQIGTFTLKPYAITKAGDERLDDGLRSRAQDFVATFLSQDAAEGGNPHDVGYVILHAGDVGVWLLTHWWAHTDICMARLSLAKTKSGAFEKLHDPVFHACVWEHVVIAHERDAWVRTVMSGRATAEYLEDRLRDGSY